MKKIICPTCGNELKVDHFVVDDKNNKARLFASRLICTAPCEYKKEFPIQRPKYESENNQD